MYLEYLKLARQAGALSPVWLGGAGGAGGGGGGPPGGWIGQLPQGLVTYDTTEAATTSGSSSLVDNLNHIRYLIANAQYNAGVAGVEFAQSEYTAADISISSSIDSVFVDVDATNAAISITPNSAGTFQVTFNFNYLSAFTVDGNTLEIAFRLTDGTTNLDPVDILCGAQTNSHAVSLSGLFTWANNSPRTIKLQKKFLSASATPFYNQISIGASGSLHMDVFRLGSIATGFVSGSGAAGRVAYWTSGSVLGNDSTFTWDAVNSQLGVGKLSLTSGSMSLAGSVLKLDASMELDPTGAINGQVLGYNGSKWVPVTSSGSSAGTSGSGGTGQFTFWSGTNSLTGYSPLDYTNATGKVRLGRAGDTILVGVNSTPGNNTTFQVTQPDTAGGTDPSVLILTPGILTAQTGNPANFLSQSATITWIKANLPTSFYPNIFSAPSLNSATSGGVIQAAATVKINGAPTSGSNLSILNTYALEITSGSTYIGGPLSLAGKFFKLDATMEIDPSGATNGQVLTYSAGLGKWIAAVSSASGGGGASGISGAGASSRIAYFTSGSVISGDANFSWDTTNQKMIIGGTPADVPVGSSASLVVIKEAGLSGISLFEYGSSLASVFMSKANGTKAAPSALTSGDIVGGFNISGFGSTAWASSSRLKMQGVAAENWTDAAQGMYLTVNVTQPGSLTSVDAFDVKYDRVVITGKDLILDANIEIDPTSAVSNQVLTYNGSKWIPQTFSGVSGISGSGAAGDIAFWTSGSVISGNSTLFWDTSITPNRLIIGANTGIVTGPQLIMVGETGGAGASIEGYSVSPSLAGFKAGGTRTSPTSTLNADVLMSVTGRGYASGSFTGASSGRIQIVAAENFTSGSLGTYISFFTTGSNTSTLVESLRLTKDQFLFGNVSNIPSAISTKSGLFVQPNIDGQRSVIATIAHGANATPLFSGLRSRGTASAPTAVQNGDILFEFDGYGYDGSAWSGIQALIQGTATENWTSGSYGSNWKFFATPAGSPNLTGPVITIDTTGLTVAYGLNLGSATSAATGQLRQSSASQIWNSNTITVDASIELDASGATTNQVLAYNGSKWVATTVAGAGGSGIIGSGAINQVAYFTSGSVIAGSNQFQWTTPSSGALLTVSTTGSAGGDPAILFRNLTSRSWIAGIDVSDSEKFVISSGSALGTNNFLTIDSSGNMVIGGHTASPLPYFALDSTGKWTVRRDTTALASPGADFSFQGGFHSALNVEVNTALFSASVVTTTSNISTFRNYLFSPGSFTGSAATKTITTAATVAISGAPTASTNAAITTPLSLWVQAGLSSFVDGVVLGTLTSGSTGQLWQSGGQQRWNGNAIQFDTAFEFDATGATTNQALVFSGGKWIPGTPAGMLTNNNASSTPRIAIWNNTSSLTGDAAFTWDGFTFNVTPGGSTINNPVKTVLIKPVGNTLVHNLNEAIDIDIDLGRLVGAGTTFTSGSMATQRAVVIRPPIWGLDNGSPGTIFDGATVAITGAPTTTGSALAVTRLHALWVQSGEVLLAGGLDLGTASGATTGQLRQSAATQIWNSSTIQFDASMELDPTGATNGQALVYNGSKWIASSAGGVSGISGAGAANQVAYFTSGSVITSGSNFTFNGNQVGLLTSGSTGGILFGLDTLLYRKSSRFLELAGSFGIDDGLNIGLVTGAATGQLKQSATSQIWGASTFTLDASMELDPTGVTTNQVLGYNGSKWVAQTVTSGSSSSGSLDFYNVVDYGADKTGATDSTAAINSAVSAMTSGSGGVLFFPRGTYKTTGNITISQPTQILGEGMASNYGRNAITQINCTSGSNSLFTFTAITGSVRDIAIKSTSGSSPAPTGGAGITVAGSDLGQRIDVYRTSVDGFYIGIDVQVGAQWTIRGCLINGPVKYGIKVRNTVNGDAGDWVIDGNWFSADTYNSDSGIRIESSGGGKIVNNKFYDGWNAPGRKFTNSIDLQPTADTSILLISNNSIELPGTNAININIGSTAYHRIVISGNQVQMSTATGSAVNVVSSTLGNIRDIVISDNVFETTSGSAYAVSLTKVDYVLLGNNTTRGFTAGANGYIFQSGCTNIYDQSDDSYYQETTYNTAVITLGTTATGAYADTDATNAKLSYTQLVNGVYRVTFIFSHYLKSASADVFFRITDGTTTSAAQESYCTLATAEQVTVITISKVFVWGTAAARTIKLQHRNGTQTTTTVNQIECDSTLGIGLYMTVEKIGS